MSLPVNTFRWINAMMYMNVPIINPIMEPMMVFGIIRQTIIKITLLMIIRIIFVQGIDMLVFWITKYIIIIINMHVVRVVPIAAPIIPLTYTNEAFNTMFNNVPNSSMYMGNLGFPVPCKMLLLIM